MIKQRVFFVNLISAICLVSAFAVNFVNCADQSFGSKIDVNFVQNLTDFLSANPGIKLEPLMKEVTYHDGLSSRFQNVHTLGRRMPGK